MRRVRFPFAGALVLLFALAAMLLVFARSDNPVSATTYAPSFSAFVSDPAPGANSSVTFSLGNPAPQANNSTGAFFIDGAWGISSDAAITDGAVAGTLTAIATLGVLNLACFIPFPVSFTMLEATTSNALLTSPFDFSTSGGTGFTGQFFGLPGFPLGPNPDNAGLAVGVTRYPDFLELIVPQAVVGAPLERTMGLTFIGTTPVSLNFLVYSPGQLPQFPASLGYPVLTILQNPASPSEPGFITDTCTTVTFSTTINGITSPNPVAGVAGGQVQLTNPDDGTFAIGAIFVSNRDADNDGIENGLDTCPFSANISDDGRTPLFGGDFDFDGIDASCDNNPFAFDGSDADLDGYANRADNCPQTPNGIPAAPNPGPNNQLDTDQDSIGDVCDLVGAGGIGLGPTTPDGHNHTFTSFVSVVIGDHGVRSDNPDGDDDVLAGATEIYTVEVKNTSDTQVQDITVRLEASVVGACPSPDVDGSGLVSTNTATAVPPNTKVNVSFSVTYGACSSGVDDGLADYILTADACHPGNPAPGGLFTEASCPGSDPHGVLDANLLDDAPQAIPIDEDLP